MRKLFRFVVFFAILVLFSGVLLVLTFYGLNRPPENVPFEKKIFTVEKGESLSRIAFRLESERLIRSALLLRTISLSKKTEQSIKSGKYEIPADSTTMEIHNLLVKGRQILKKITVPEGWTISKIADVLEAENIVPAASFEDVCSSRAFLDRYGIPGKSAEGYLFPDTYQFPEEYDAEKAAAHMVDMMFRNIERIEPEFRKMTQRKLYDKIIVASIIEREYRVDEEAPLISSVFYNRMEAGIGLESCATIEYIITEIEDKPHPSFLTFDDLDIESPYNTYLYAGLPPGPICNPGKTALHAAFHPAETDYWYFLLKDRETGEHYFSKDLHEHNKARKLFLKK